MTSYLPNYRPPIPSLLVQLAVPDATPQPVLFTAVIDTGADITLVPAEQLEHLGAPMVYQARLRPAFGPVRMVNVFLIDLIVDRYRLAGLNVVAWPTSAEIILGRDVLNQLIVVLDGPQRRAEVLSRQPA